jgi:hypothetical protein
MRLNGLPIANRMGKLDGDVDDRFGFDVEDSICEISVHYVTIKGLFGYGRSRRLQPRWVKIISRLDRQIDPRLDS